MAAYSTIWCKLTFFSNLPKKRSPPKKPSNKGIDYPKNNKMITYKYWENIETFLFLVNLFSPKEQRPVHNTLSQGNFKLNINQNMNLNFNLELNLYFDINLKL